MVQRYGRSDEGRGDGEEVERDRRAGCVASARVKAGGLLAHLSFQAPCLGVCVEEELRLAGVGVVALEHLVRLLMRCDVDA